MEIEIKTKRNMPQLYNQVQILQNTECTGHREYSVATKRNSHEDRVEPQPSTDSKELKLSAL